MSIPKDEQESTFLIDGEDSDFVDCYSCSIVYVRKLKEIATDLNIPFETPYPGAIRVRLPIECILLRAPRKKREVTDEFREAARDRFNEMHRVRRGEKLAKA